MRLSKLRRWAAFAAPALLAFLPLASNAAEPFDNDELVAGPEFQGLPDRDSHSGVFHDLIADGNSSLSQPAQFAVTCSLDTDRLRLAIFDGNAAGLWDQNLLANGPDGAPLPDGSVVRYVVTTNSPDHPAAVVAVGESEAPDAPSADVTKVFANAIDSRWEFLVDAPHHPNAQVAETEEYAYRLVVSYRLPVPTGGGRAPINGYKVAANGVLAQDPGADQLLLAGFIGGVVDARNLLFAREDGSQFPYSVSRDHYPDVLEPPPSWNGALALQGDVAPAVRFPAGDAFVNRYAGSFSVRVRMVPRRGESWAQFLTRVVLEEGDADDVDDTGGVARNGAASPTAPGVPPDDGRPYTVNGVARDNSGYRLPTSTEPSVDGSPWLELYDPLGALRVVLFDLSGNVSQETGTETGFEAIPIPADGLPGDWVVVMHNLDARNSWFLRTNLEVRPVDGQSLSGRVFEDLDCDGDDDVRVDPPLAGIRVQALRTDVPGAAPRFAVTDALGAWRFDPVPAGTWSVSVVPGQPALAGRTTSTTLPILRTLAPRQNLFGLDIGFCPIGTIGDRVWYDRDGNGTQSADEPGLPGVSLELLDGAGQVIRTTATDADGAYRFDNLAAGGFTVRVVAATVPAGYAPTTPSSLDLVLPAGGAIGTADFGYRPAGSVGDRVWRDDDGDDVQDDGEPGLPGVTVELRSETDVLLATQQTVADGRYLFAGLDAGTYFVRVLDATAPAGSIRTTPTDVRSATIPAGGADVTLDFGYRPTGSVAGTVFRDGDGDGVRDPGEPPIGGVEIRLLTRDGLVVATTTTRPDGTYEFTSVPVGDYLVNVVEGNPVLDGLTRTTPGQPVPVTVAPDVPTPPVDFGYRPSQDVSGRVWLDRDGDGVEDPDEPGLRNVSLELVAPNGVVRAFRTTGNDGAYLFEDVPVGAWTVRVVASSLPPGLASTTPPTARPITVVEAAATTNVDFGYRGTAAVGDRIWLDLDGDTQQDAGEPGIPGVVVDVVDDLTSAPFGRRTTGTDGLYLVDGLPAGTYRLVVDATTLPRTVVRTSATASPVGSVAIGGQNLTLDVGYRFVGAVSGRVFDDADRDGSSDAGEDGLPGAVIELVDAAGTVVATATTGPDGAYRFDGLPDGGYTVRVVPGSVPAGLDATTVTTRPATVAGGGEVSGRDFGYARPGGSGDPRGAIGDRVWLDVDGDGVQDAFGEPGLVGVTLELLDGAGGLLRTTQTVADGRYLFDRLPDGTYGVRVVEATVPAGLARTFPATATVPATVLDASTDLTKDFGYRPAGVIGGLVWRDGDGNGLVAPAGEPGLEGVRIDLLDANGNVLATTTTLPDGTYRFFGLPDGAYVVRIDEATLPTGSVRTFPGQATTPVTLTGGGSDLDNDYGYRRPGGAVGDRVWFDRDGDAAQDGDEAGIPGVTLELLDVNGAVIAADTTDFDGAYLFDGLPDGDYVVRVVATTLPSGVRNTFGGAQQSATVLNASTDLSKDFGYQPSGTITGRVFNDVDGDGTTDAGEPGIPGAVVELVDANGDVVATTTTGPDGTYTFDHLPDGAYTVRVQPGSVPAGLNATSPTSLPANIVGGSDVTDLNFGYDSPTGAIGDRVWFDTDGDGVQDAGEDGIPGVTLELVNAAGQVISTEVTNSAGGYLFDGLADGTYTVRVVAATLPTGLTNTFGGAQQSATVLNASTDLSKDFGYQPSGTISGRVFNDVDGDGTTDAGEPGIPGAVVELVDANGDVVATTTTGPDGTYTFDHLPDGAYTVRVQPGSVPAGLNATTPTSLPANIVGGSDVTGLNFGYDSPTGAIGDRVWFDVDGDGVQDAGEAGIPGVTLELVNAAGQVIATEITNSAGGYLFDGLADGTYAVRVVAATLPAGLTNTSGGAQQSATITSASTDLSKDFGYQPSGTITGRVFNDVDGDGTTDAGEPGIPGAVVELVDANGDVVATTTTGPDGTYTFDHLPDGAYTVRVQPGSVPAGLNATTPTSLPAVVADGNDLTGLNFGYDSPTGAIGDRVWFDVDGDGVQDAGEDGIPGVTLELVNAAGQVVATEVTNSAGGYLFDGLADGTYTVRVVPATLPAGLTNTFGGAQQSATITSASTDLSKDFGYQPSGTISGRVFNDVDGDGTTDAGEPGIPGAVVELVDSNGNVVATTTTGPDGTYTFDHLPDGAYTVRVQPGSVPAGLNATTPTSLPAVISNGSDVTGLNFGFDSPTGAIGDRVWFDTDGDGVQDAGEDGIPGVTLELVNAAGQVIATEVTNSAGGYLFDGLADGTYTVRVVAVTLPAGLTNTFGGTQQSATITSASTDLSKDFGYQPSGTISGRVFNDVDGDGTTDAGEPGIPGAVVELVDANGDVIATTTTGPDGTYTFDHLPDGAYTVRVQPGSVPAGLNATTPTSLPAVITGGNDITGLNFGYDSPTGAIGDRVWFDVDGDGVQDAGEDGIPGVTLELVNAAGQVISTEVTNSAGGYLFDGLADGTYTVRVVAATLPAGLTNTFGGAQQSATVLNAATDLSKDFGYQPSGTITGRVFNDVDGDGTTDAGEPGIPGAVVELVDANGDVVATTTTGPDGTYTFDHLPDGAYTVRVQPGSVPAGLNATTPTSLPAVVANGNDVTGLNFGYDSPTGAIGDRVWFDTDGDGIQDAGEDGIPGVTLELVNAAGQVIATEVTNSAGGYLFDGLADGTYTVRVVPVTLPAGLTNTFGGAQQSATVLNASTDLSKDFGYQPSGTITGRVFNDVDGDGTTDASEPGIPGAVVELVDANGDVVATTTTGPDGTYTFDHLPDGAYTVRVQPGSVPAGLNATTPTSLPAVISNGSDVTGLNFGYDSPTGAIGDRVWFDTDGDGIQDAGEDGISGVTLELVNAAGQVIATEVTNSAGGYLFDGLADGTYTVRVVAATLPAGLTNTFGGAQQSATITSASTDLSRDFGYQPSGTISGRVFNDTDGDGTTDAGEPGIPGAVVELVDSNGDVVATTTTGPDGSYTFDHLPDGSYTVRVQPGSVPAGLNATTPTSLPANIVGGSDVTGLNFGYDSPTGAIGDRVWFDVDGDGIQDAGEDGISGVTLELVNAAGQVIATEVTSSAGGYLFDGLADGTYTVRVVAATLPAGLTNTFGGAQQSATITSASTDLSKDFGYQPSGTITGRVFNDVDSDGTTDAGEPGIPGAVVELVDSNGNVVATTTTGPDGSYTFDHLPDGAYSVRVQPGSVPAGLNATTPTSLPAVISNGNDVTGLNFGYDSPTGAIGDRVWFDTDGDGVQDAGEAGIPGVTLELVNAAGQVIATEVTNSAGGYLFDGLADGTYTVRVVAATLPAGLTNTFGGTQQSATITSASTDLSRDFGYQPSGTITGRVFNDVDGDGTTDAGEPGIPGAVVELVDSNGDVVATTTTGPDGSYTFDHLPDGAYTVRVQPGSVPAGLNATTPTSLPAVITGGNDVTGLNFGYDSPTGAIGDRVWFDVDGDGVQDAGEDGIPGVTLELVNAAGQVIATEVTNSAGGYLFDGLADGPYTVRVVAATLPAGLTNTFGGAQQSATVLNASTDLSRDFGYQPSGTITGRVFNDVDGDGTTDAGEPGIPGAVVELVDANGDVVATTTTGPDGTYTFDHLPDGAYTVRVQPGSVPAGLNATTPTSLPAAITGGNDVTGLNFGYDSPTGAIGDRVWFDTDGDGVQDAGEDGVPGVTLELVNAAGQVIATEVTNSAGGYLFDGLADGTYTVRVVPATLPAGLTNTFGGAQQSATVSNASTDLSKDFGYQPSGTITGRVFNDTDGDGTTDAGEPGIPGAVVELVDANGDVVATTTTGPDGSYTFDHLPDGAYTVRVQPSSVPAGLNATTPTSLPANIVGGNDITGLNFGYDSPTGAIGDRVWFDTDGDGVQDAGEDGIPGVTLELVNAAAQVIATEVTNSAGGYLYDGLADGTYTVRVVAATLPAGLTNTFGGAQQSATVLNASTDLSKDFGYQPSGSISGRVFNDVDGDGTTDAGEPGIPGAVVELVDANGDVVATTTTGPDGSYTFDHLPDGAYTVRVQPSSVPAGLNATTPTSLPANIVGGNDITGLNFGYDSPTGAIGDRVWFDTDGDGVQDAGEDGIPGVTLELVNAAGQVIATEVTNSAGGYLFVGVADGTYTVRVVPTTLPAGLTNTFGGAQQSATITNASTDLSKDFGYRTSTPPPPPPPGGAIGDRVWADTDGDGVQDADELGLPGVTVQLLNAAGQVIASDVTDDAGGYLFSGLANGLYTVRVVAASVPPGLASTTGGLEQPATVTNGSTDRTKDFGFGAPRGALGGRVWLDADGDGLQDAAGEPGLAGVTVELLDASGRVVASQLTGPGGSYVFSGLVDGAYQLRVVESTLPAGLARTFPANATVPATVAGGSTDLTKDFGYRATPPTCDPGTDPRVHEACFEASVWLADPHTRDFDVYVRVDRGTRAGDLRDLVSFGYTGAFPGTAVGANGVLRVEGLTVEDGYAKVRVCVTADPGAIDGGYFDGPFRLEVVVNGVGEAAADTFTRASLVPGATFPRDWTPLWCDDVPDFAVTSVVPFACWEPPAPPTTCVRDVAWWRAVHRDGACAATRVPWPLAGAEGRRLCGRTWRSILDASAKDDAWVALAQAFIAAQLNVAAGNAPSRKVADAIDEAGCLLVQGCRGFCGLAEERAVLLHRTLKAFNRGNGGPPACAGAVPTCPPPEACPVPDAGPSKDRPRKERDDDRPSKGGPKPRKGDDRR